MNAQAGKTAENAQTQPAARRRFPRLRPMREWKVFKPICDRWHEINTRERNELYPPRREMQGEEYLHIHRIMDEISAKAGIAPPWLYVDETAFDNAHSFRKNARQWAVSFTEGFLSGYMFSSKQEVPYFEKELTARNIPLPGKRNMRKVMTMAHGQGTFLNLGGEHYLVKRAGNWLKIYNEKNAAPEAEIYSVGSHEMGHIVDNAHRQTLSHWMAIAAGLYGVMTGGLYLVALTAQKNAMNRLHERRATRFAVEMNGQIKETILKRHERTIRTNNMVYEPVAQFILSLAEPLSELMLDGYVYKAMHALLPLRVKKVFRLWHRIDGHIIRNMENWHYRNYVPIEGAKAWTPWCCVLHFVFSDHPSLAKEIRTIEKAERKYRKEHPDWKPPEQVGVAL